MNSDILKISRWRNPDCCIGRLEANGFYCFTLELPWMGNRQFISCIPARAYKAVKHKSPNNGSCIWIKDVPDRELIQIHAGNYTRNILGCILVGDSVKYLDMDAIPDVTNSKNTLAKLLSHLPDEFEVVIEE